MSIQRKNKLNYLLKAWPKGTVAVSSWLKKQGIYRQLLEVYQKSSWVESIGHGAFKQADDSIEWTGAVYALQRQNNLNVVVGGRTALELQGQAHFIPLGENYPVFLFGNKRSLPAWFQKYPWKQTVNYVYTNCFSYEDSFCLTMHTIGSYEVVVSCRELAIMEVLYLVDQKETYEHAALLMEGLLTLRPQVVQKLLTQVTSIKVKRLFMHFAEMYEHPWLKYINLDGVDFGKGKRVVGEGGSFDSKYNISVPKRSNG